ncbi:MAG: hypothetical protein C4527_21520 [Candidatus Omnitrophota bacterium]|jgi:hypothetical protein|nr:MAG: hypothetical protein C4527_21520 [Candidatus Omnitrophota bacterium]
MVMHFKNSTLFVIIVLSLFAWSAPAQDITYFFKAGDMSGAPDRFGNTYKVGPASAILHIPIGDPALEGVYFEEDDLWSIYPYIGDIFLISHAPGFFEDAPELTAEITVAMGGKYEVILNFLDSNSAADTGPIQAALGDEDLVLYSASNTNRRSGGTAPPYPIAGGTSGAGFWYSVSLGEVEVDAGGTIKVRIDDTPGDQFGIFASFEVGSTFHGITLRVIELSAALSEIQVSPGVFDWFTDVSGNQFRTRPVDESLAQADWLTVAANSSTDNKWNIRQGLGPYGPIIESFPNGGEDAPTLRTSIKFAEAGTYDVYFSIGDTAAADPVQNEAEPNPLIFGFEGQELKTWVPNDGIFKGTPGYNDYEVLLGQINVTAGEQVNFLIDDAPDYPNVTRSVYLGMRFVKQVYLDLDEITVSPGVFELFTDIGGNKYMTWPQDKAAYPTQADWLTVNANSNSDSLWNIRQNLGTYGPILEAYPSNENAPALKTTLEIRLGGTYNVYLRVGDTGQANPAENLSSPCPIKFGMEGQELKTYGAWDGTFQGTPGYNDYEVFIGEITVANGEVVNFITDDAPDYSGATRSVFLGIRLVKTAGTNVGNWSIY